jgi:Uma2 family endonuclease
MAEAGVFREDDRLELLDGEVVQRTPIGKRHAGCVARLSHRLWERCGAGAIVNVQNPLVLSEGTEFYPDIALLRSRPDFFSQSLPRPADVLLVIEVADTTGDYDRGVKVPRYARAGIAEVWVVDLSTLVIDVYRQPSPDGYRDEQRVVPGDSLVIPAFPDQTLDVVAILA